MAKTEATPIHRTCGTMEVHERLLRTDPAYVRNRVASENNHFHAALRGGAGLRTGVTVIPVVVHVVWKTNAQNISDAQIQSQIDVLNHDYRKTNSDIGSIPSVFAPLAADARIEFELASTDPNGNATNGITRDKTTKDSFVDDDGVKHASSGGSNAWDSTKYLNLWVCQLGNNLLGYAQFPGGAAATDGVVILHSGFGTSGTAAAPFNLGRTATHEVGHWLNLRHIWGDDGGGCNGDDFIADTPNCADHNFGKPGFPHVTCNNGPNGDMFMNYMDYTDDDSMFMFTIDQVTRMQACLDGDRASIGHQKPGPKLKFADDPKMKFVDDPKFKFVDDPINTLKFKDDPKLKFADDPKFKFVDDPINTLKFRDDPKLKFADDPIQTFGGGDDPNWPGPVGPDPAPFVLATPHHSTAWSRSYPGAHAQSLAAYEQQLRELEGQLAAYQQAQAAGALSAQEAADAEALFQAYARLAEEYRQLGGQ